MIVSRDRSNPRLTLGPHVEMDLAGAVRHATLTMTRNTVVPALGDLGIQNCTTQDLRFWLVAIAGGKSWLARCSWRAETVKDMTTRLWHKPARRHKQHAGLCAEFADASAGPDRELQEQARGDLTGLPNTQEEVVCKRFETQMFSSGFTPCHAHVQVAAKWLQHD